jgi:hypothetical protein
MNRRPSCPTCATYGWSHKQIEVGLLTSADGATHHPACRLVRPLPPGPLLIATDEHGEPIAVARPDKPDLALQIAGIAHRQNDREMFERLPAMVEDAGATYRFRGWLGAGPGGCVIVDAQGNPTEWCESGDSFITLSPLHQKPRAERLAPRDSNSVRAHAHPAARTRGN